MSARGVFSKGDRRVVLLPPRDGSVRIIRIRYATTYLGTMPHGSISLSDERSNAAREIAKLLRPGARVALMTHVNADGDGSGSEVALWHLLKSRGVDVIITNPTPFPERYQFLLDGCDGADQTAHAVRQLEKVDVVCVLDVADLGRLGHLADRIQQRGVPVACIDHHLSDGSLPDGPRMVDATACATGELIYDFAAAMEWRLSPAAARAVYVAILTDTGGFRFSNTTARALRIAAQLIELGTDPEQIYLQVYASEPVSRIRLLAELTDTLVFEPEPGLGWITVPRGALERHGVTGDHLEGVVELVRSIDGVRLALLFRTLVNGRIKISFRSVGTVSAVALAERFGGGGHLRAAGASVDGDLAEVQERVLAAARAILVEDRKAAAD